MASIAAGRIPSSLLAWPRLGGALASLLSWTPLGAIALFAVPKKRVSKSRQRIRRAGQLAQSGPRLVTNTYTCPECAHQKLPHRVCGRPDCDTLHRGHRRAVDEGAPAEAPTA
jgi:ribosomal protein L32